MTSRPSLDKRSAGRSRPGTDGNERPQVGHGSTPRSRNTSCTENRDSWATADRTSGNRRDSNSGRTNNTSLESHVGGHTQELTNAQPRNYSNSGSSDSEYDGPKEPGTRKRKIKDVIRKSFATRLKKKKSEYVFDGSFYIYCHTFLYSIESEVCALRTRAQGILRFIGPFISVSSTFVDGCRLASAEAAHDTSSELGDPIE